MPNWLGDIGNAQNNGIIEADWGSPCPCGAIGLVISLMSSTDYSRGPFPHRHGSDLISLTALLNIPPNRHKLLLSTTMTTGPVSLYDVTVLWAFATC